MRGRKTDNQFIEEFIIDCAKKNKFSVADIRKEAISILKSIDEQIKQADQLKKMRTKYIDVLDTLITENDT